MGVVGAAVAVGKGAVGLVTGGVPKRWFLKRGANKARHQERARNVEADRTGHAYAELLHWRNTGDTPDQFGDKASDILNWVRNPPPLSDGLQAYADARTDTPFAGPQLPPGWVDSPFGAGPTEKRMEQGPSREYEPNLSPRYSQLLGPGPTISVPGVGPISLLQVGALLVVLFLLFTAMRRK